MRQIQGRQDLSCGICRAQMVKNKCKISYPNCGYTLDCSDP